jgi:hypothetical protein
MSDKITLDYLKDNYGDTDMLLCGRHTIGEDRISSENSDMFIITSYWDDRFDSKTATTKNMKLKHVLENIEDHEIAVNHEDSTIIVKFGNRFK